ncbi:HlyD family secretion protein [Rhodothermus marinus]|uniref:HlyD family secretion protein n=1 Tax=Rhodothermus marinus TaxID=29549 RepID=UPI0012BA47FF|nr:efflux RND transporter periplasmic adaptor subunit [Rhodothermus marinus]BBM70101.1 hemolysin secretion protein D [Rhodothermus marinus]BBM73087.1 hemolysin secretion protein D [Rhodothermus marinus]
MRTLLLSAMLLSGLLAGCRAARTDVLEVSGTIEATEVQLAARTTGEIVQFFVDEGDRVARGQPLVCQDTTQLALQLRQAEADVAAARANLALLEAGARSEDLEQAEARLQQAETRLEQARRDAARLEALHAQGSATDRQLEDARLQLRLAEAEYRAAQAQLEKLRHLARPEELAVARARVAQAEARRDLLRRQLDDACLEAPIDGIVSRRVADPGELAAPGSVLLTLVRLDTVYVQLYIPEPLIGAVQYGQPVTVRVDTWPDRTFEGRVTYISPEAEFTPRNVQTKEDRTRLVFRIKVTLPNPEGLLKPGMPADATLQPGA